MIDHWCTIHNIMLKVHKMVMFAYQFIIYNTPEKVEGPIS